jgi:hypothetical protein
MRYFFLAFTLTVTLLNANGQNQDTIRLSFRDALKRGLKNNLELNQQRNLLFARQVQKNQRIANFCLPLALMGGRHIQMDYSLLLMVPIFRI